jgi:hypothetical protein
MAELNENRGSLNYYLVQNPLIKDKDAYMARVKSNGVYDLNKIVRLMQKYNSTATFADIKAVMEIFFSVVGDVVADGGSIRLPIVNIRPAISGSFATPIEPFDSSRHTVLPRVTPGEFVLRSLSNIQVSRQETIERGPRVMLYTDCKTSTSSTYSSGFIGKLAGKDLNFDETNPSEGLFIINEENDAEVKVEHFGKITNAELMFTQPTLTKGAYYMEVRKAYGTSKELRSGTLKKSVVVE